MDNKKLATIQELLLWETALDAIVIFNKDNVFQYANKSIEDVLGYKPEELLGCYISKIQPPFAAKMHVEGMKKYLETGQKKLNWKAAKATGIHKNGEEIPLEISFSHIVVDGEDYFAGCMRNIQERVDSQKILEKTNEELLNINEELKKTNQELDHFVYSISHDLRAPLLSILGLINISKLDDSLESYKKYTELIEKNVLKLDIFILEILDYSRNMRTAISVTQINTKKLIDDTIVQMQNLDNFNKIDFKIECKVDLIFGDEARLKIILNNLVSNSIKYQNISNENPYIIIRIQKNDNYIEIYNEDNGIGIHPDRIDKIFDMFYRASTISKGAGIGLYIVKETVKKLNGNISVESQPNNKTFFKIQIPIVKQ